MTVKVSKSAINLREKLAKVDQIDLEKLNNLKMRKINAGGYALEIDGGGLNIFSADPDIQQRIDLRKGAAAIISSIMGAIETDGTYNQKAEISYSTNNDVFRIEANEAASTIDFYSAGYKRFTGSPIVAIANSVTPPAWRGSQKVLSLGDYSNFTSYSNLTTNFTHNVYFDTNNDSLIIQSGQRGFTWGANSLSDTFSWNIGTVASPTAGDPANLVERMTLDADGHLIVPAGVTLGTAAATYNAANTLDDYEEGTWTPNLIRQDGTISATFTVGGSGSTGSYVKIGAIVHVKAYIFNISVGSSDGTGYWTLTGLPFAGDAEQYSAIALAYNTTGANTLYVGETGVSGQGIFTNNTAPYTGSLSGTLMLTMTYRVT